MRNRILQSPAKTEGETAAVELKAWVTALTICDAQQIAFEKLLFATKQGMIKRVDGSEFQVAKRTIAATKLQEEDALIHTTSIRCI